MGFEGYSLLGVFLIMSWTTEATEILRNTIDDADDTPVYSDERLHRLLLVAAFQVNLIADFVNDYTVDIETTTLDPDPTSEDDRDDSFVNLMCLKAACILERGKAFRAAGNAGLVKEFSTTVDLQGVAKARAALLAKGGFCPTFQEELETYQLDRTYVAGAAIMGPFRTIVGFNQHRD